MKNPQWFLPVTLVGTLAISLLACISIPLLFLGWNINGPYIYDPPRKQIASYTHITLAKATSIDRYEVRNFFFLDGPYFYFELTLSADDKTRLVKYFEENKWRDNGLTAKGVMPAFLGLSDYHELKHYSAFDPSTGSEMLLDVDAHSSKAWMVVWNF